MSHTSFCFVTGSALYQRERTEVASLSPESMDQLTKQVVRKGYSFAPSCRSGGCRRFPLHHIRGVRHHEFQNISPYIFFKTLVCSNQHLIILTAFCSTLLFFLNPSFSSSRASCFCCRSVSVSSAFWILFFDVIKSSSLSHFIPFHRFWPLSFSPLEIRSQFIVFLL